MFCAGPRREPTCRNTAPGASASANRITSSGIVAEKNIVCREAEGGSASAMRRTSGQKPMSIIRSASSSTKISSFEKSPTLLRMWSSSRPGVATTMSTPALRARSCGSIGTPP
jgi:hypothetical protein